MTSPAYFKAKTRDDLKKRYGPVKYTDDGGLHWVNAGIWTKPLILPDEISAVLRLPGLGKPLEKFHANIDIHRPMLDVFDLLIANNVHHELETFDGCFNVRYIRGRPGILSLHSYAIAVDFNAAKNPLGSDGVWSETFIKCFETVGFVYGGKFTRKDPMHFEWYGENPTERRVV